MALTPLNDLSGETEEQIHDVILIGANKGVIRSYRHLKLFLSIKHKGDSCG